MRKVAAVIFDIIFTLTHSLHRGSNRYVDPGPVAKLRLMWPAVVMYITIVLVPGSYSRSVHQHHMA